jgi:hypothetical protein
MRGRAPLLLILAALALPQPAAAQVRLVPFVGTLEPIGHLGSPSGSAAQNGVFARQAHAVAFGLAAGGHLTGLVGVEGGVAFAPSGVGFHAPEPSTGGDLTLSLGGWMLMANALSVIGHPSTGLYGVAGVGVQKRWGAAWEGVARGDLWSVGGVVGLGTAARLTDRWRLDLRAELRLYGIDPDGGGGTSFGSSLATELVLRVGVPLTLAQPRGADAEPAQPALPRPAARDTSRAAARDTAPAARSAELGLPAGESATEIVVGGRRSCARTSAGMVRCWGVGAGAPAQSIAAAPAPEGPAATLAAGREHTCALSGRTPVCWGDNGSGQLGADDRLVREHRVTGVELTDISAGEAHTCGVAADGRVLCWGANDRGQLGDGSTSRRAQPAPIATQGRFTMVAAGGRHSCALRQDGVALCWGDNWSGQVGSDMIESITRPVEVAGGSRFVAIAAGARHTCALDAHGAAWCWGANGSGQLGDGSQRQRQRAAAVSGSPRFTAITAGGDHTCALTREGAAWCWGRGREGQLGDGAFEDREVPVRVRRDERFVRLALGDGRSCGLTSAGRVACWGDSREAK